MKSKILLAILALSFAKLSLAQIQTRWAKNVNKGYTNNDYPRPQLKRSSWINLNGPWDYSITENNQKVFNKTDGKILVPYPIESALSGVKKTLLPSQLLWYRRTFRKPRFKSDQNVILHFGAVDWKASVYVNGKEVGNHSGGYTSFSFDVTSFMKPGENELIVKVYDPTNQGLGPHGKQVLNPANIYYTASSGIWQTVWLETVPSDYIKSLKMTPDIDKGVLNLSVYASSVRSAKSKISVKIPKCIGCQILTQKRNDDRIDITLEIPNAKLWSPDDPHLYDLEVSLGKDKTKSYFGMRKITIAKDAKGYDRIMLNNKFTFNLGTLDQGFWPEGLYTAPTDEALAFDIKAIKAMGFNTIRKHIKVEPARWYYYADKIGMLVWQDMVNPNQGLPEGSKQAFETESADIINQLYNYPSITTWVLFNENWGQYDQERLTKWMKAIDPTRLINGHSGELLYVDTKLKQESESPYIYADMTDVHSYPNPMLPVKQANKAQVIGEFGGIGVPVPGHQWDDLTGWGYVQLNANELENKYEEMIKQIKGFIANGLSASIYTQPFDVEGEENGLMTYDREIIKIALKRLREIHSQISCLNQKKVETAFFVGKDIDKDDNDNKYEEFKNTYENGKRDSMFLRRLTLIAYRKQDQKGISKYGNAYLNVLQYPFSKENLKFLNATTRTSQDPGFDIYFTKGDKVNQSLGKHTAERKVRTIIGKEELEPYMKDLKKEPNWEIIRQKISNKYAQLGEEKFNGARMIWALQTQDWKNLGKYYVDYYATSLERSEYHMNNVTWQIFEHVMDKDILNFAVKVQLYNIENFSKNDPVDIDTYANLLYKIGRKDEAIQWEEKAVKLSNNGKEFLETLGKMKSNIPTWPQKN